MKRRTARIKKALVALDPRFWIYVVKLMASRYLENSGGISRASRSAGTVVHPSASLRQMAQISMGSNVRIGPDCCIWPGEGARITIGDNVIFGPRVGLFGSNHGTSRGALIMDQQTVIGDVTVGSDCWLGANSVVLPGVTLGDGSVVAAGAVVTTDVPAFAIVGGVPARVLTYRR